MSTPARIALLVAAVLCATSVALLGGDFSRAVEPESYTAATSTFWLVVASAFAAPMWAPALIPNRYLTTLKVFRRVGAITLLIPIYMFGSIVVHSLGRSLSGSGGIPAALVSAIVLASVCLSCLVILLWPARSRQGKRTA